MRRKLRPMKLQAVDIPCLKHLFSLARKIEERDLQHGGDGREALWKEMMEDFSKATPGARYWFENVPSDVVKDELNRWVEAYRWEHHAPRLESI